MLINKAIFANNRIVVTAKSHCNLLRMLIAVYLRTLCSPLSYKCLHILIYCEFSGAIYSSRCTVIRGTEFAFELSLKYEVFILLLSSKRTLSTIRQRTYKRASLFIITVCTHSRQAIVHSTGEIWVLSAKDQRTVYRRGIKGSYVIAQVRAQVFTAYFP
jgi:hypothetical protein